MKFTPILISLISIILFASKARAENRFTISTALSDEGKVIAVIKCASGWINRSNQKSEIKIPNEFVRTLTVAELERIYCTEKEELVYGSDGLQVETHRRPKTLAEEFRPGVYRRNSWGCDLSVSTVLNASKSGLQSVTFIQVVTAGVDNARVHCDNSSTYTSCSGNICKGTFKGTDNTFTLKTPTSFEFSNLLGTFSYDRMN